MAVEIYRVKTFDQIYDAMKRWLIGESSDLNNFNKGSRLSVLLEAIAMVNSQTQNDFYQALKKAIPISIYNGFDFPRLAGNAASGQLQFYRQDPATEDYSIPVGTQILLNGITFETIASASILLGQTTSGPVNAVCSTVGVSGNIGINAIDTESGQGSFVNQPNGIQTCKNPLAFSGGSDEETDEARAARFRVYINSLSRSNVQGIAAGALSVEGVKSVTIVEYFPTMGWITLYVDDGTGTVSEPLRLEVLKTINGDPNDPTNYPGYRAAGIQVQVLAPVVVSVPVQCDVKILTSSLSDDATIRTLVQTAIEQYINALRLGNDVVRTEVITAIHNAHPDVFDVDLVLPANNIAIPNDSVARTSTVTVTSTRVTQ